MRRVIFEGLTLKRFLRLPEAKPALEYIDGSVVQKVAANRAHSVLHTILTAQLLQSTRPQKLGFPYVELRCTFGGMSLVPDISFIKSGRIPKDDTGRRVDDIFFAPDLAIEIISPGQTVRQLSARLDRCVREGVSLGWLILPMRRQVLVFRPNRLVELLEVHGVLEEEDGVLDGEDVIPGFTLPLAELFGWLDEE